MMSKISNPSSTSTGEIERGYLLFKHSLVSNCSSTKVGERKEKREREKKQKLSNLRLTKSKP